MIVGFQSYCTGLDIRTAALLSGLVFLFVLLGWRLLESAVTHLHAFFYSLTREGRAAKQKQDAALAAEVDAIMAKIRGEPALFMGPPKPPAWWLVWLKAFGYLVYMVFIAVWSWGALHLYQQGAALHTQMLTEDAASLGGVSAMRMFRGDEPGKLYLLSAFLAIQVLGVLAGTAWEWRKAWNKMRRDALVP